MKLSTLKEFIEALGCELNLIVNIPGKGRVAISNFFDEDNASPNVTPFYEQASLASLPRPESRHEPK